MEIKFICWKIIAYTTDRQTESSHKVCIYLTNDRYLIKQSVVMLMHRPQSHHMAWHWSEMTNVPIIEKKNWNWRRLYFLWFFSSFLRFTLFFLSTTSQLIVSMMPKLKTTFFYEDDDFHSSLHTLLHFEMFYLIFSNKVTQHSVSQVNLTTWFSSWLNIVSNQKWQNCTHYVVIIDSYSTILG
jgi:hypothetical protein